MLPEVDTLKKEIEQFSSTDHNEIEQFRIRFLGKNGILARLFDEFRLIAPEEKKIYGQKLNTLKTLATDKYQLLKNLSDKQSSDIASFDPTLPSSPVKTGTRHPISIIRNEITDIFYKIGFTISEGPEIEDDWHNFSGLNFAQHHPARDMQDTFFIQTDPEILLRTHTSSVQVRVMESEKPPIRKIFPGRVFRNEAISARAHCIFHQVEGLYIDRNVSFSDLKQTLLFFAKEMFGENTQIRLRPSFFPFTEPSAEMDISCSICRGKGCNVCKYTGFLEILGCGMVDPNVLESASISSKDFTGFAFGMGIERTAMLKYQVNDLRLYFENDIRFLKQFTCIL